jgi:hypothetical protein
MKQLPVLKKFYAAGLCLIILASGNEIYSWYFASHDWTALLSRRGLLALILFTIILISGLALAFLEILSPPAALIFSRLRPRGKWLNGPAVVGFLFVFVWILLYSPWAVDFPGQWTRFALSIALACWISFVLSGPHRDFGWREVVLSLALFLYISSVAEVRALFVTELASRSAVLIGGLLLLGLIYFGYSSRFESAGRRLRGWRASLGRSRWAAFGVALIALFLLRLLAGPALYWFNVSLRFAFIALLSFAAAFFLTTDAERSLTLETGILGLGLILLAASMINATYLVSSYPFSLSWSEGDRFYDYSMIFGQKIYKAVLPIPNPYTYGAPGRFVLWGFPFLVPGLPIWFHRLWGNVLSIAPPVFFAWLVSRKIADPLIRYALAVWISLFFIVLTPVYAPILVSAIVLLLTVFEPSVWKRIALVIVASVYAGLSRWTWFLAPAAWAVLADLLLYYPQRTSSFFRKISPTILIGLCGLAAGFAVGRKSLIGYSASETLTSSQPLLWYRLFPNQTYSMGIIFGALILTGPLLIILGWWMASRRWKLDWLQMLAVWAALFGFLGAGLVVSTKIGGGGDLHNLDMYLVTLTFVFALGIYSLWKDDRLKLASWPFWIQALLCWAFVMIVYPFTPFGKQSTPAVLNLPPDPQVQQTLQTVRTLVEQASRSGPVLFMDERQLLTFGYIRNVPLIPDYEKKYMMDQSLASNAKYFHQYYVDLSNKRFALIVSEPLKHIIKSQDAGVFPDENDAWVKWVSDPTLCFYKPIFTDAQNRIQLLVPRPDTSACRQYLSGG